MKNLAVQFAESKHGLEGTREKYDCACIDFAGDLIDHLGRGRLIYFENPLNTQWRYHAAVEVDGIIHDLWHTELFTTNQFAFLIGAVSYDCTYETIEA